MKNINLAKLVVLSSFVISVLTIALTGSGVLNNNYGMVKAETSQASIEEQQLNKILTNGKPTILHFTSKYCLDCVKVSPIIDELESKYKGQANFIHIDVKTKDPVEKAALKKYRVLGVPIVISVDTKGKTSKTLVGLRDKKTFEEQLKKVLPVKK